MHFCDSLQRSCDTVRSRHRQVAKVTTSRRPEKGKEKPRMTLERARRMFQSSVCQLGSALIMRSSPVPWSSSSLYIVWTSTLPLSWLGSAADRRPHTPTDTPYQFVAERGNNRGGAGRKHSGWIIRIVFSLYIENQFQKHCIVNIR